MYETVLVASRGPVRPAGGAHLPAARRRGPSASTARATRTRCTSPRPTTRCCSGRRRRSRATSTCAASSRPRARPGRRPSTPAAARWPLDPAVARAVARRRPRRGSAPRPTCSPPPGRPARRGGGRTVSVHVLAPADGPPVALCDLQRVDDLDPCAVVASPAPGLDPGQRAAVASRRRRRRWPRSGVRGVAAVDVVLDVDGPRAGEVRCALPVEHPVSELRCDVDLVEQQLLAAAGEPRPGAAAGGGRSAAGARLRRRARRRAGARITALAPSRPAPASTAATARATSSRPGTTRCWRPSPCCGDRPGEALRRAPAAPSTRSSSRGRRPTCRSSRRCWPTCRWLAA